MKIVIVNYLEQIQIKQGSFSSLLKFYDLEELLMVSYTYKTFHMNDKRCPNESMHMFYTPHEGADFHSVYCVANVNPVLGTVHMYCILTVEVLLSCTCIRVLHACSSFVHIMSASILCGSFLK